MSERCSAFNACLWSRGLLLKVEVAMAYVCRLLAWYINDVNALQINALRYPHGVRNSLGPACPYCGYGE